MRERKVNLSVPTYIVGEHNESFHYWQKHGLRDTTLLHVDAHSDMGDCCYSLEKLELEDPLDYYKSLCITNFLCAAVHYEIVSSLYWLNPHSLVLRLQDMGSKNKKEEPTLNTSYDDGAIQWNRSYPSNLGKIIQPEDIEIGEQFILDIDLDAFCCNKTINFVRDYFEDYDGVTNYGLRMDEFIDVLGVLRKPDLITISRSVGDCESSIFVPLDKVNNVRARLVRKLKKLYDKD